MDAFEKDSAWDGLLEMIKIQDVRFEDENILAEVKLNI